MAEQRPGIRRKSSAQNLLSQFKPGQNSLNPPATPSTPVAPRWDADSLYSDNVPANNLPQGAQGTSVEYLRDLVQKRIITLNYIHNIHEGRSHWFHTILISKAELEREFNNNEMKKRTARFATLGMSLSSLLDIQQPQDLLRGLINTLSDYDQSKEESDKPRMRPPRRLFRTKPGKRGTGVAELSNYVDMVDNLVLPQVPFPLDYHQTLLSLLDVLSEVYHKISKLLGPSPLYQNAQHMMGPLGLIAPQPGVSYLFTDRNNDASSISNASTNTYVNDGPGFSNPNLVGMPPSGGEEFNSSLWAIANATLNGSANSAGALGSPPPMWLPAYGEMVLKIDGKFKKIITVLLKELDQFARNGIRDELSTLNPLLQNTNLLGNVDPLSRKVAYDWEG